MVEDFVFNTCTKGIYAPKGRQLLSVLCLSTTLRILLEVFFCHIFAICKKFLAYFFQIIFLIGVTLCVFFANHCNIVSPCDICLCKRLVSVILCQLLSITMSSFEMWHCTESLFLTCCWRQISCESKMDLH